MVIAPNPNAQSILPLSLKNVTVRKRGKVLLNDVSAQFEGTGFTIVMGPNGSGKTTLLRTLHGLERIRSGSLTWYVDLQTSQTQQAFVFQTPIIMRRSVLDNIAYPLILSGVGKQQAREQAHHWMEAVGLAASEQMDAHFLSGGERQKLAIARALIAKPQVLFLDEPTTNLDGRSTREIEDILQQANQSGTRLIMTTHDLGQAKRLASDIVFLHNGQILETGSAKAFFNEPKTEQASAFLKGDIVE